MTLPEPDGTGFFIEVRPDLKLHVVSSGSHQGLPVIFLHGYPEFWWSWRHQLAFLGEHNFHAIAPDLRGVNHSDSPPEGYDPVTLAGDIIGLMDAFEYSQAAVIGDDYGGFLAYILAMNYPDRIHKLGIINTLPPGRWPGRRKGEAIGMRLLAWLAGPLHGTFNTLIATANQGIGIGRMMLWLAHNKSAFPFEVRHAHSRAYERGATTATRYVPATANWLRDHLPREPHIHHPTLIVWPERDFVAPGWILKDVERTIPNVQIVTVPRAGRFPHQEQPETVNAALLDFLFDDVHMFSHERSK